MAGRKKSVRDPMLNCADIGILLNKSSQTISNWIRSNPPVIRGCWIPNGNGNGRVIGARLSAVRDTFPMSFSEDDTDAVVLQKISEAKQPVGAAD